MSSTRPLSFGAPAPEAHIVIMSVVDYHGNVADFEVFRASWNGAQAVWHVLDDQARRGEFDYATGDNAIHFLVRSADDPRSLRAKRFSESVSGLATKDMLSKASRLSFQAFRIWYRKAIGECARDAVADESLMTLSAVQNRVREDCQRKGIVDMRFAPVAGHEIADAVKSRIIVGRVSTGYGYNDRGRAYFLRKKDAPLHSVLVDGRHLNQTTLAYRGEFTRIPSADIVRKEYRVA